MITLCNSFENFNFNCKARLGLLSVKTITHVLKKNPVFCKCSSCECGIYTFEDSEICKACKNDQHLSGAKRIDSESKQEKTSQVT